MNPKPHYVTQEGLEKLQKELRMRKTTLRREIAERIDRAKELGDLSENAEYAEAKDEQGFNEGRILELEDMLQNTVIIKKDGGGGSVKVGSKITTMVKGEIKKFTITGASEADPSAGFISNESPLGKAFLGRRRGEEVEVEVPVGKVIYKILEIS